MAGALTIAMAAAAAICMVCAAGYCATTETNWPVVSTTRPSGSAAFSKVIASPGALLLHLPGIGGYHRYDWRMLQGLRQGGLNDSMAVYDWTEGDPGLHALVSWDRNQKEAKNIADLIVAHAAADPGGSIILMSHSGGCALAVWALEKLPPEVKVQTLVMLAPALSPDYNLSAALAHVAGHAYSFTSLYDTVVLYTGTRMFGTMDGEWVQAAGYSGFIMPAAADRGQYQKLIACPYQAAWSGDGDYGNHLGAMSLRFSKAVLAPLLLGNPAATQPSKSADVDPPAANPPASAISDGRPNGNPRSAQ